MKHIYLFFLLAFPALSFGQITGRIWQDGNANGQLDQLETGAASVRVRAYNLSGQLVAETHSGRDGPVAVG